MVLGYLNPEHLAGGAVPIDGDAAARALEAVATPLGKDSTEAAYGVFQLAVATMTRAVKAVSTYRGRDPRDFVLCGFGGNGPVVAVAVARALQMRRVLVPPAPGVFSAAGLLLSEIEHEFLRTLPARGESASAEMLHAAYRELEAEAERALRRGRLRRRLARSRFADIRYPDRPTTDAAGRPALPTSAGSRRTSTQSTTGPTGTPRPTRRSTSSREADGAGAGNGDAPYVPLALGLAAGYVRAAVLWARARVARHAGDLGAARRCSPRAAPLIMEEYDATCVVPPGCSVTLDALGSIDIALDS